MFHLRPWAIVCCLLILLAFPLRSPAQNPAQGGYGSRWFTSDGTQKLALEFAGSFTTAAGSTRHYQKSGWNYQMGGGYNFNRRLSVPLEYSFNRMDIPQPLINSIFDTPTNEFVTGHTHLWSITAEPTWHYFNTEHLGGYIVGGGGFYRKLTVLKGGISANGCMLLYPCITHDTALSNNAGGLNIGTGFAWRPSDEYQAKFFIEARYTWIDNQPGPTNRLYPPANFRTAYFPSTNGVRW